MSARKNNGIIHGREIARERAALLAAVKRLTRELRRLEDDGADIDDTEAEACEELAQWAEERARERARDTRRMNYHQSQR